MRRVHLQHVNIMVDDLDAAIGFYRDALGWLGVAWKLVLVQLTWVSLGLAAIALLRSTGIAIGVVVAYSFVDGILALWEPYGEIALTPATATLFGDVAAEVTAGLGGRGTTGTSFTQALIVVLVWVVLGIGLAWVGVRYREA